jgi:hypothetical protein
MMRFLMSHGSASKECPPLACGKGGIALNAIMKIYPSPRQGLIGARTSHQSLWNQCLRRLPTTVA